MPEQDAPWTKDEPFTKEQIEGFNIFTHFPTDINKEFKERVKAKESEVANRLKEHGITDIPEDVKRSLWYYRKALYEYYLDESRARATAPPVSVIGPAAYPVHRIPKADRIREKGRERIEIAERYLNRAIKRHIKGKLETTTIQRWLPLAKKAKNRIEFGKLYTEEIKKEAQKEFEKTSWGELVLRGAFDYRLREEGRELYDKLAPMIGEHEKNATEERAKGVTQEIPKDSPRYQTEDSGKTEKKNDTNKATGEGFATPRVKVGDIVKVKEMDGRWKVIKADGIIRLVEVTDKPRPATMDVFPHSITQIEAPVAEAKKFGRGDIVKVPWHNTPMIIMEKLEEEGKYKLWNDFETKAYYARADEMEKVEPDPKAPSWSPEELASKISVMARRIRETGKPTVVMEPSPEKKKEMEVWEKISKLPGFEEFKKRFPEYVGKYHDMKYEVVTEERGDVVPGVVSGDKTVLITTSEYALPNEKDFKAQAVKFNRSSLAKIRKIEYGNNIKIEDSLVDPDKMYNALRVLDISEPITVKAGKDSPVVLEDKHGQKIVIAQKVFDDPTEKEKAVKLSDLTQTSEMTKEPGILESIRSKRSEGFEPSAAEVKKRIPSGGLQRAFWDAVSFYEGEGYSPKKAEEKAYADLKKEWPEEMKQLEKVSKKEAQPYPYVNEESQPTKTEARTWVVVVDGRVISRHASREEATKAAQSLNRIVGGGAKAMPKSRMFGSKTRTPSRARRAKPKGLLRALVK